MARRGRRAPSWSAFAADAAAVPLVVAPAVDGTRGTPPPWAEWRREARRRVGTCGPAQRPLRDRDRAWRPRSEAAVDPGLHKGPRDLELPPWNKGRYGTALGRAVHAVLQTVDLATGDGLDDTAAAQAAAEGIIGREDAIAARARVALATPTVREAVAYGFRREMYVGTPVGATTLEGYVDLVYRRPDGLVVVDYKTDTWRDDADLDAKVARYRLQGASYAVALEQATGEPVAECVFVFLGERDARRAAGQRSADGDA